MDNYSWEEELKFARRMTWLTIINTVCLFAFMGVFVYTMAAG